MTAIWTKKTPATKIGETVDVLVNNYGEKDQSIKEKIYKELKLAANDQDSTSLAPGTYTNPLTHAQTTGAVMHMSCHAACHSACHSACHGSRGWRKK